MGIEVLLTVMFSHEYFFKNILNTDVISDKIITSLFC